MEEKERIKVYRQSFVGSLRNQNGADFDKWKENFDYISFYEKWKESGFKKELRPIIVNNEYVVTSAYKLKQPKRRVSVNEYNEEGELVKVWPFITKMDISRKLVYWSSKYDRSIMGRKFKVIQKE